MTDIDLAKLDKLPKWALQHINNLTRTIEELRNHVRELSEPDSIVDTDTVVHTYSIYPDVRLEKGALIRFTTDNGDIDVQVARGILEVRGRVDPLVVLPRVTNVVEIELRRQ